MAAVLGPWPWLDGGATAVLVATVFDGATVDEELLWRGGGRVAARLGAESLGDGALEVRLGACGFELVVPRACDGDVAVGGRAAALRELSLCGVTVLPLGPRTRVTVRAGLTTFVVAGTTPPKKVPLGPPVSWRRRAGVAVAALAGAAFVAAVQATAPRTPSWTIGDTVRVKVALMMPSLQGGRAASLARETSARRAAAKTTTATPTRAKAAATPTRAKAAATPTKAVASAAAAHAQMVPNQDRASPLLASRARATNADEGRKAAAAASVEDARKAAAMQARAAGVVGVLAQYRAAFLGDVHVAASDAIDTGSIALGAGDDSSASGSDGASGDNGVSGSGTGNGNGSGVLAGDEVGEAYGEGGLGLSGTGVGGGAGDGAIGVGDIGTIGCGCGSGTGVGYGSGAGGLGGRRATVPDVVPGSASVRGSCDKDLIRRVVRAHVNELRFCYERVLPSRPTLAGRVATRFVIGFDGRVSSSAIAASALTPAVDACVADAILRWQFEPRCVGEVDYPFVFEPIASAP